MLRLILFVSVVSALWEPVTSQIKTSVVQTTSGPIQGEEVSFNGTNYKAFRGIPYAAPPLKELRFKAPSPPKGWTEVRDTTTYGKACPQPMIPVEATDEDCLTINVYTQSLGIKNLKPVLLYIHEGGFFLGTGPSHGPEFLIHHDLVIVTFNYRLGAFGFLATNSSDASGNWGMKDQVAAMKWVKANIVRFGGDPKKVTIYGESAGGASVHLHLFSPLSKGLFQKAIISSGSALNMWGTITLDEVDKNSRTLSSLLGATDDVVNDPQKMISFLRAADANQIITTSMQTYAMVETTRELLKLPPFSPIIEAPGTKGAFLVEDPKELLPQGSNFTKVPMIMGFNNLEGGLLFMVPVQNFTTEILQELDQNLCGILPQQVRDAVIARNECLQVAQRIRDVYFGGKGLNSSFSKFIDLWGDMVVSYDMHFVQKLHAQCAEEKNPLYNYFFTFDGNWNMYKQRLKIPYPGATHADDISYVFKLDNTVYSNVSDSSPEVQTMNRMTTFISNFVKTGNPTPTTSELLPVEWKPSNRNASSTMVIGTELKLENEILKNRMGLWDELYRMYVEKV